MLRLNQQQRLLLADKLFDIGNLAAGALVFGQFIGERAVSQRVIGLALAVWASGISLSLVFTMRKKS
jgi:hypothetical protein